MAGDETVPRIVDKTKKQSNLRKFMGKRIP